MIFIPLVIIALITSCAQPAEEVKEKAIQALENGDIESAEEQFSNALEANPDDPDANAGMAVVYAYKSFKEIGEFIEDNAEDIADLISEINELFYAYPENFGEKLLESFGKAIFGKYIRMVPKLMSTGPSTEDVIEIVNKVFDEIESIQNELDSRLVPLLESLSSYAEKAAASDVEIRIYPNRFDNDGDGESEPEEPMKFKAIMRDGSSFEFDIVQLYEGEVDLSNASEVKVSKDGGDAWFDYDYILCKYEGREDCEVNFDENDYIVLDKGEMIALKMFADLLLSYIYRFNSYKFTIPSEIVEKFVNSYYLGDPSIFINYLDSNGDSVISKSEIKEKFEDFLTFREPGEDYLPKILKSLASFIENVINLADEISSDEDGTETHNLTSSDFFPDSEISDELREELTNIRDHLLGEPIEFDDGTTIDLSVFINHPERFSDLKDYFPDFRLNDGIVVFEDTTFGGVLDSDWNGEMSINAFFEYLEELLFIYFEAPFYMG